MRNLWLVLKNGVKRSKTLLPGAFLMVGIMVLAFMGGRQAAGQEVDGIPVGVIDRDQSRVSADMLWYMEERLGMVVTKADTKLSYEEAFDRMTRLLLDCKISVIVEIPEGLEKGLLAGQIPNLEMTALDDYANEAYTKNYLSGYLQRTKVLADAAAGDTDRLDALLDEAKKGAVEIEVQNGTGENVRKAMDESGLSLMIGFFTFVGFGYPMFMGMLIQEDKKNGTFKRIQVSSVKPAVYIGGMAIGNLLVSSLIVAGVLIFLTAFGLQSNVPLWLVGVLMLLFLTFSIGFNLMASFLTKAGFTYMTVGVAYIAITNILGGAYFPLGENVLARFSVLTPQYFMLNIVRGIGEDAGYRYGTDLCILVLMAVLVYLIAAVVYARREN